MAKAGKLELHRREKDIQELMADGYGGREICEIIANKYKVSPRTIERQYYEVVAEVGRMTEESRDELRTRLMARNDRIYRKAMDKEQYDTALRANLAQAKISGLDRPADRAPDVEREVAPVIMIRARDEEEPQEASEEAGE